MQLLFNFIRIIVLYLCLLHTVCVSLNLIKMKPEFEFQDRSKPFLITCNTSSEKDNISMTFHYENKKYTVKRVNNITGIYVGNFSAVSINQNKVLIMCTDSNVLIGVKLYALGYPPSIITEVDLKCRDFNFRRVICNLTPDVFTMQRILGFEENNSAQFRVKLYFTDSDDEISPVNSTFNLSEQITGQNFSVNIVITNLLGNFTKNFTFDKYRIQKPNEPKIDSIRNNKTNFYFTVDMSDYGIYLVNMTCNSIRPKKLSQTSSFKVIGQKSKQILSDKWPQNSDILCDLRAYVTLGDQILGHISDSLKINIKLLEGKPNVGPYSSPMFVNYSRNTDEQLHDVHIYYTDLPLEDRNGIITNYRWNCDKCIFNKKDVSYTNQYLSANSRSLRLDAAFIGSYLSLWACTAEGCSDTSTIFQFQLLRDDHRRLSVIKHSDKSNNVTILWNGSGPLQLLVCSYGFNEHDCSSVEIFNLTDGSRRRLFHINSLQTWKFALHSSNSSNNYKLKWVSCFYNSIPQYEAERKLKNFNADTYVKWVMTCTYIRCDILMTVIIPNCDQLQDVFFNELSVSYESNVGYKGISIPLLSENQVKYTLSDFNTGWKKYKVNISVITASNTTVLWFSETFKTSFWCPLYIALIVLSVILFILVAFVILWCFRRQIKKSYFKKIFRNQKNSITTTNNQKLPIYLLNANNTEQYLSSSELPVSDESSTSSHEKEYTMSTNAECSDSSISNSGEGGLVDVVIKVPDASYIARPGTNTNIDVEAYSFIAIPSEKGGVTNKLQNPRMNITTEIA